MDHEVVLVIDIVMNGGYVSPTRVTMHTVSLWVASLLMGWMLVFGMR
jgi:hypothetical protein